MSARHLESLFDEQRLPNGYELVDGVAMHAEHGARFQIPPEVLKRHISVGDFIELRIDSPRFSMHDEDAEQCSCPSCHGPWTKPILQHEHPATLRPVPRQDIPSRGWGEDFWVRIARHEDAFFEGVIDNDLYESRLHGLDRGDTIVFRPNHVLHIHDSQRLEYVRRMDPASLKELAAWIRNQSP